jgi:hypothetical protein
MELDSKRPLWSSTLEGEQGLVKPEVANENPFCLDFNIRYAELFSSKSLALRMDERLVDGRVRLRPGEPTD